MPSAIANTTHTNIIKYMFYPPFQYPAGRITGGASLQETSAEAPTRYYRLVMWSFILIPLRLTSSSIYHH